MPDKHSKDGIVDSNRKAFHEYFILEKIEAGIVLLGTEVKSLREGRINLKDSFAHVEKGEIYLYNCHISPYSHGNIANHEPERRRKLLLKKREIERFIGKTREKGLTLVALKVYFKKGLAKVELGLAKGKKLHDKRESAAKKSAEREIERAFRGKEA